jgi:lactoylglutathione lyase
MIYPQIVNGDDMELNYTSIRVKDLKKSVEFYTKNFGMKIVGRKSWVPGEKIVMLLSKGSKQRINLMYFAKNCMWYTPYTSGSELDHLMFEVDDAKKLYGKLVARGAPAATELWEHDGMCMGYVKDPNGIWVGVRSERKK